ncbi:MAG: hypothetical protein K2X87_05235 [Gemmataceae bacterium]|nr:hypothetical protein [Gemmataceae bacterium]
MNNLLGAYAEAGEAAKAVRLFSEARKRWPQNSPQLAGELARFGLSLLQADAFAEAEPLLRDCLAIREKTQPGVWTTFNTRSLFGGALVGQKKYAEAGPLLVTGYEGMKQREKSIPPAGSTRIPEALDRLVELSAATNQPAEAARWRAERAKYRFVAPPPRPKK